MTESINFTVKSLNGDSYKMVLPISTTIGSVMDRVQVVSNSKYAANSMRLIYAGKDLSSDNDKNKTLDTIGLE